MDIGIFEFIRDLIYKESLFFVDNIVDLGFVERRKCFFSLYILTLFLFWSLHFHFTTFSP